MLVINVILTVTQAKANKYASFFVPAKKGSPNLATPSAHSVNLGSYPFSSSMAPRRSASPIGFHKAQMEEDPEMDEEAPNLPVTVNTGEIGIYFRSFKSWSAHAFPLTASLISIKQSLWKELTDNNKIETRKTINDYIFRVDSDDYLEDESEKLYPFDNLLEIPNSFTFIRSRPHM